MDKLALEALDSQVDGIVLDLYKKNSKSFIEGLRDLVAGPSAELYTSLFGLIIECQESTWGPRALPEKDALGRKGLPEVVRAIQNQDVDFLLEEAKYSHENAILRLVAVAAQLRYTDPVESALSS